MDITSANSSAVLTVDELFPAGIVLQKYGTDQSITQDEVTFAEPRVTVDGKLVGGFVPSSRIINVTFEPDSPSLVGISQLIKAQEAGLRLYKCGLTLTIPSIRKVFNFSTGILKKGKPMPDLKKILDPQTFSFEFEKCEPQDM